MPACFLKSERPVLHTMLGLVVFALILPISMNIPLVQADIYRWQDAEGLWHFSDSPPSNVRTERLTKSPEPAASRFKAPPPATPDPASPDQTLPRATGQQAGLFWHISKAGRQPSYLLGTIHSTDPRVTQLRPAVQSALEHADQFVMEMIPDTAAMLQFGATLMLTDGRDLEGLLGAQIYQEVVKAMEAYGMPEMAVRQLKPWAVMALLSMPKPNGGTILDMVLYQRAQNAGLTITGLESAQEQLAVFESLSMEEQIALLKMTLNQLPFLPTMFEALVQAYLSDDLSRIETLATQYKTQQKMESLKRFMFKLNDERNHRMVQRILPYLEQGNVFVAIGALHLAGPTGLVNQLRTRGYLLETIH